MPGQMGWADSMVGRTLKGQYRLEAGRVAAMAQSIRGAGKCARGAAFVADRFLSAAGQPWPSRCSSLSQL